MSSPVSKSVIPSDFSFGQGPDGISPSIINPHKIKERPLGGIAGVSRQALRGASGVT
jgi:hypothetical protein